MYFKICSNICITVDMIFFFSESATPTVDRLVQQQHGPVPRAPGSLLPHAAGPGPRTGRLCPAFQQVLHVCVSRKLLQPRGGPVCGQFFQKCPEDVSTV